MVNPRNIQQTAVEQGYLGLAELDAGGHFVAANQAFLSMLGVTEDELLGEAWVVSVHADDHTLVEAAHSLARSAGRGYVEIRGLRSDPVGKYQALNVTGAFDAQEAFMGYHYVRHDISGYKADQEALALAVESAPSGLLILDSKGEIQFANRAIEHLFGYSRDELAGRQVETLLPERFRDLSVRHRDAFDRSEDAKDFAVARDLIGLRKDGVEIPLQVNLNRIETATGKLTLCTILDIAERVRHEQQLELAKQTAETANRAKSDFLARMSHEIRTPMNLIMGMNALLLNSPLNDKQRQQVEISYRNVRRLLRLINGILDLSKVEAGMLVLNTAPFDLNIVMSEASATMSSALEQKDLLFELSIDPGTWLYWVGDAERLLQVLLNLIGNSIKFTAQGSVGLKVSVEPGENGQKGLRFEVTDTGCGILPEKASIIFEAFQQADGSMNRPYEGTGLGLSIAKMLVEMMSGRIWVDETHHPGSRVVFTAFFPPASADMVAEHKTGAASGGVVGVVEAGSRLLIVEDNPENVILLRAYLENVPIALHFAVNGVEAVEMRRKSTYDLVLMDIQMPVMDGHTATREIRAWEKANGLPRVPIVALTAHALSGARAESMEAGCDGHLTKPIERNELVEAIAKFARRNAVRHADAVPEPIATLRPAYLANRWIDLAKLREALAARDFPSIQRIGHNCKGTGTGYGFPEISQAAAAIERGARALDSAQLEVTIQQFEECVQSASARK